MKIKNSAIYLVTIAFLTLFLGIGYATVNNVSLVISGSAESLENGEVEIINVTLSDYSTYLKNPTNPQFTANSIFFDLTFNVPREQNAYGYDYHASYEVTLKNDSLFDYQFASSMFTPSITTQNDPDMDVTYSLEDIELNETIPAKTTRVFHVTITLYPRKTGDINITGEAGVDVAEEDSGSIIASLPANSSGNLRGSNQMAQFSINVINTFKESKSFNLSLSNANFSVVNSSGNSLGTLSINSESEESFAFYIKRNPNVKFPTDEISVNVYFEPTDAPNSSAGVVTLLVDKDETFHDLTPPTISNVVASQTSTIGSAEISWTGTDNVGIDYYTIETYKKNGNSYSKTGTTRTIGDETTFTVSGLSDATYYFKVYGIDPSGNTATQAQINSCSTSSGVCSRSNDTAFKWTFNVTTSLTNAALSSSSPTTVQYGQTYTATVNGTGNYDPPTSLTVKMGGTTLTSGRDYTYNSNNGSLSIPNVTGDISIAGEGKNSGGCLAKGTKIMLANGKTKNIEDIGYDDLLAVWNYDFGTITYEYPLWIENEHKADSYIKITFNDGTSINIIDDHAFYDTDLNLFVNLDSLKVGSNIAKINNDGKFDIVTIKNIEKFNENTTYYFVGSTTYYNVIANNILTTDHYTLISNLYKFENGAKWSKDKQKIVSNKSNLLNYSYFKDVLPYYLYKGFRVQESGYLINNNILDLDSFKYYINDLIINPYMIKKPITKDGSRYWMVTNSYDDITDYNKEKYLYKEGTMYTLPKIEGVKYWYSTADNKIYKPGVKIEVVHGLHFIANKLMY